MVKRTVLADDHEVLGQMISDFTHVVAADNIQDLIEKYDYQNVDVSKWYSCQQFLDFIDELEQRNGGSLNLVGVGLNLAENGVFPPGFEDMPIIEIWKLMSSAYPMNNRGTNIGSVRTEVISETHVKNIMKNPHSDDVIYGTVYGIMRRFATPKGYAFKIYYDPGTKRREHGGEETVIHIEWWLKEKEAKKSIKF